MSLLDFARDFGAGFTGVLAQERSAAAADERKSRLEEQRQANLAAIKAQNASLETAAMEDRRRAAATSGDPTELFAITGDPRFALPSAPTETKEADFVPIVDVEQGTIRNILEGSDEHREGLAQNRFFNYNQSDFQSTTDHTGRQSLVHVPSGARISLRDDPGAQQRRPLPSTIKEAKETPLYIDSDTQIDLDRIDMADPIERSTGIQANALRLAQRNVIFGNIWTDAGRLEAAANVKIGEIRNRLRVANVANQSRPSNFQLEIVQKFLPSEGWFSTTSAQEAEFDQWRKTLYGDIQLQRSIAYDPNQNHTDAERRAAREMLQNLEPAYADIMGLLAVRQIRNTEIKIGDKNIPLINFAPRDNEEERKTMLKSRLGRLFGRRSHNTGNYSDLINFLTPEKVNDLRENDPATFTAVQTYLRWAESQGW
jgi:hypothetical protein